MKSARNWAGSSKKDRLHAYHCSGRGIAVGSSRRRRRRRLLVVSSASSSSLSSPGRLVVVAYLLLLLSPASATSVPLVTTKNTEFNTATRSK